MHARMTHSHSLHGMDGIAYTIPSQAAAGQSSSHRVDIYDWPSRGPLELMVVHAAVQRFASFHRGRPRAITGSTSHSACYLARAASGCFCVSLERDGLNVDGPWHQIWTVQAL